MAVGNLNREPRSVGARIRLRGCVQGVGMRPAIWRLARERGLTGGVHNDAAGVLVELWGEESDINDLLETLQNRPPPLARVEGMEREAIVGVAPAEFHIDASTGGGATAAVLPDAATCEACRAEVLDPAERRYRYPFASCTHCGPRLSIQTALPWDRGSTSMDAFALCAECAAEYGDPSDRRFHAQPVACDACGPRAWLADAKGVLFPAVGGDAVAGAARLIREGRIVAIKGLGGFHLACDARNAEAVLRLRAGKRRDARPFALMARDMAVIQRYCRVDDAAASALCGSAGPIVLLPHRDGAPALAGGIAPSLNTLGIMLPTTPLQHLLLQAFDAPVVMTSGNLSGEPPCTDNDEALERLGGIADAFLLHDRPIVNRLDDSLVRCMAGEIRVLRLARGYAPARIPLPPGVRADRPLLALGGELKASFCLLKSDGECVLSQHIGDLEEAANSEDFRRAQARYRELFRFDPTALVVDGHPDYLSRKLGSDWAARENLPLLQVQHHHAHIAACMAENAVPAGEAVLGVALDGLGYGEGGEWWGGEFLLCDYRDSRRLGRLQPLPLIGGAQAMREPWRNAYAHIDAALGWEAFCKRYPELPLTALLRAKPLAAVQRMLARRLNCPLSSTAGRWFDAVAAAVGVCPDRQDYEGQAAMQLEALAEAGMAAAGEGYPLCVRRCGGLWQLEATALWPALLDDLAAGVDVGLLAARFHEGLARGVAEMIQIIHSREKLPDNTRMALSGGVFQNRLLLERVAALLQAQGVAVLMHRSVPPNDGALALGQAVIGAVRLEGVS